MPAEWFCDYGSEPSEELKDPYTQRVKSTPWKYYFSMLFIVAGLYLVRDDWVYTVAVMLIIWILLELSEDEPLLPPVSDPGDITLPFNGVVRNIAVIVRFNTGWDE